MAPALLATDDLQPLMDEVSRFSKTEIGPMTGRPEKPASADEIFKLSQAACEFGLLPAGDQHSGFALWAQPEDTNAMAFSLGALRQLASVNAGIALAWHRNALAHFLARSVGFHLGETQGAPLALVAIPTGHYGLARGSLARWLLQRMADEDQPMLADWLDRNTRKTTVTVPTQWQALIWPTWIKGVMSWQLVNRSEIAVTPCHPQHGLDELRTWQVSTSPATGDLAKATRQQVSSLLVLDALGLLAIAAGANQHCAVMACEYAGLRRQGGRIINQHAAVQTMLARIQQAGWEAEMILNGLTRPLSRLSLKDLVMARQQLHPVFCKAANLAMQVHGGIGYMRDCGPEKLLRDQNMLRLQSGGVREIPLFIHAWGDDQ